MHEFICRSYFCQLRQMRSSIIRVQSNCFTPLLVVDCCQHSIGAYGPGNVVNMAVKRLIYGNSKYDQVSSFMLCSLPVIRFRRSVCVLRYPRNMISDRETTEDWCRLVVDPCRPFGPKNWLSFLRCRPVHHLRFWQDHSSSLTNSTNITPFPSVVWR